MTEIPANVARNLTELSGFLEAERDENTCRKNLTPEESVAMKRRFEPFERAAAKERQREHSKTAPGKKKNTSAESAGVNGESRDHLARAVGMGRSALAKAEAVVDSGDKKTLGSNLLPRVKRDASKRALNRAAEATGRSAPFPLSPRARG